MSFCGYIAFLGRPNAGKSTLLNAMIGCKIAGVSRKAQTTRNRITGIFTEDDRQLVFLDTPGLHKAKGKPRLNQLMNQEAWGVVQDADVVCYLIDGTAGWQPADQALIEKLIARTSSPIMILVTKEDAVKKTIIQQGLVSVEAGLSACKIPEDKPKPKIKLISARRRTSLEDLRSLWMDMIPEGPMLFDEDEMSASPEKLILSELIREQLFRQTGQELPYGASVRVDSVEEKTEPKLMHVVHGSLIVSRDSHKGMVIGKRGQRLKSIGQAARESLESYFETPVFLDLHVQVQQGWMDEARAIAELQFNPGGE
ncbi:MAG: GTPase Era [Oligoflexales bacterium]